MVSIRVGNQRIRHCDGEHPCVGSRNDFTTLYNETLFLKDYRMPVRTDQMNTVVHILKRIGFLKDNEGWREYQRYISRLLWNPSPSLMKEIEKERYRIGLAENQVGVHIRCAGFLADTHEGVAIVTPAILATIPNRIEGMLNRSAIPRSLAYVYLSTDSSIAFKNISDSMYPVSIKCTALYHRGHSTDSRASDISIRRSLLELFLISQSKSVLLTANSGFSLLIDWMNTYNHVSYIGASYSFISKVVKATSTV